MPDSAGSWPNLVRFYLALSLAIAAVGLSVQAASDARPWPEQADHSIQVLFAPRGGVSLTGFGCDSITAPSSRIFAADPDYSETPFTVGLESVLEETGAPSAQFSERTDLDGASAADVRTPLSARLSTVILQSEISALRGDGTMEDVFVPEASMSVADLMALCVP
jgi:hypothetical protein